jgi:hypothetical protein
MIDRMRDRSKPDVARAGGVSLCVAALAIMSGCQSSPTTSVPAPELQLLEAKPLVIADDCSASGSYFIGFTVLADGRTGRIRAPSAPACVQQALTAWVSSFRYSPPGAEVGSGIEWMLVSASKGS